MTNQKRAVIQKIKMVKNLEYQDTLVEQEGRQSSLDDETVI